MEDINLGSEVGEIHMWREEQTQRGEVCTTRSSGVWKLNPIGLILKFIRIPMTPIWLPVPEKLVKRDRFPGLCMKEKH